MQKAVAGSGSEVFTGLSQDSAHKIPSESKLFIFIYFFSSDRKFTRKAMFTVLYAKTIFIYFKGKNMCKNIFENHEGM